VYDVSMFFKVTPLYPAIGEWEKLIAETRIMQDQPERNIKSRKVLSDRLQ